LLVQIIFLNVQLFPQLTIQFVQFLDLILQFVVLVFDFVGELLLGLHALLHVRNLLRLLLVLFILFEAAGGELIVHLVYLEARLRKLVGPPQNLRFLLVHLHGQPVNARDVLSAHDFE